MNDILIRNGFEYIGKCKVCGGRADLYRKGLIECKVKDNGNFNLKIKNNNIRGKINELERTLEKYLPQTV